MFIFVLLFQMKAENARQKMEQDNTKTQDEIYHCSSWHAEDTEVFFFYTEGSSHGVWNMKYERKKRNLRVVEEVENLTFKTGKSHLLAKPSVGVCCTCMKVDSQKWMNSDPILRWISCGESCGRWYHLCSELPRNEAADKDLLHVLHVYRKWCSR